MGGTIFIEYKWFRFTVREDNKTFNCLFLQWGNIIIFLLINILRLILPTEKFWHWSHGLCNHGLEDRVEHSTFIEKIGGKIVHNRCWGLGQREVRRRGAGI